MKKILQKRLQFCNLFAIITLVVITNCNFLKGVTVIFTKFDVTSYFSRLAKNELVNKVFGFVKSNKIIVKITSYSIVAITAIIISILAVGVRVGFNVNYSGKVIATVSNSSVFYSAKDIAVKNVKSNGADKAINSPVFLLTLTVEDKLSTPNTLADAIIENSNDIIKGSALIVNGETVISTESSQLEALLEERRTAYFTEGAENTAYFTDSVEIMDGFYLAEDLKSIDEAKEIINTLSVKTVSTSVTENTVKYSVKKVYTGSYENGYHKVQTKGENGLTRTTVTSETLNGTASADAVTSTEVIKKSVEQIEIFGTAKAYVSATEKAQASSNGFIFPLNRGSYKISAYYGDGRSHKGVDLSANKGTPIFAVSSGTVTYAGYDSDFGYNVIVDHGNGIKTRYAHASALCVSNGARVSQGDMIATVGSTGWSTGNHLHFEVIVNGVRVNPAPYIGL